MKKYQSITNSDKQILLDYYKEQGVDQGQFYNTEKAHGANFSIIANPQGELRFFSRTEEYFPGKASFHDCWTHLGDIPKRVAMLAKLINKTIQVYFEYIGSGIIGKNAINYFKDNTKKQFIGLEILIVDEDVKVDYPEVQQLFESLGVQFSPFLGIGTLEEMLKMSPEFKSFIGDNDCIAEGFVTKPVKSTKLPSGEFVILKTIAPSFREGVHIAPKVVENKIDYSESIDALTNETRIAKVASKFNITTKDKNKLSTLIIETAKDIASDSEIPENAIKAHKPFITAIKSFFE